MQSIPSTLPIAIDAMGGDFGPSVTVPASIQFLRDNDAQIILVGLQASLDEAIAQSNAADLIKSGRLSLRYATEVVGMDESPAKALKRKKDSSMRVAINLVKEGNASAAVSSGNTGALMATARFVLKTVPGVDRPAIISNMPCPDPNQTIYMLDLGANVDSTPEMLMQFGVMGSVLAEYVDKKPTPKVALLNIGAEEIKGSEKVKKAASLLSQSSLNYVGYIEADEMFTAKVDVIVCDGFEGNVALKASEGTAHTIFEVLSEEIGRGILSKIRGWLALPVLRRMKNRLDPRVHNGATLIGLNGIVVKSHGGADQLGFVHAINEANTQINKDILSRISHAANEYFSNQINK